MKRLYPIVVLFLAAACNSRVRYYPIPLPPPEVRRLAEFTGTPDPPASQKVLGTAGINFLPLATLTPGDTFLQYTIPSLRSRQYGGGEIENLGVLSQNEKFLRYSIRYPSDGLKISGYVNVPKGKGPFPVIIVLHGYANPSEYDILDYTTGVTDEYASEGYFVVHPNYRNFRPSESGDTLFRVGYAVDVLNLISLLEENSGKPGLFEKANTERIGLWGHSLGGSIALKVGVINSSIKAIVLYAPMSGDEQKNSQFFHFLTGSQTNQQELRATIDSFAAISPDHFYENMNAAVQLHHGTGDSVIPIMWAEETCNKLKEAKVKVECFYYDGAEHTFRARYLGDYNMRVNSFFATYLKK